MTGRDDGSAVDPNQGRRAASVPYCSKVASLGGFHMMYGWWDGSSWPWYGMIFGPVMMIVYLVIVALIIAWLLHAVGLGWRPENRSALDILRDRFARGEIDRSEYEERRKLLSSS
jgi:putative membrane protein